MIGDWLTNYGPNCIKNVASNFENKILSIYNSKTNKINRRSGKKIK